MSVSFRIITVVKHAVCLEMYTSSVGHSCDLGCDLGCIMPQCFSFVLEFFFVLFVELLLTVVIFYEKEI